MQEKVPQVSVCIITYNQEKYIRECLQSVVDQKTNFDYEVLVADDCSTDGTKRIIREFAESYPKMIKPIFHSTNIGVSNNFIFVHKAATGEYIAHLDGDDYWLPGKLQIQKEFLDKTADCNVVFTRMIRLDRKGNFNLDKVEINKLPYNGFTRADIFALGTVGAHSSKMYRAKCRRGNYPHFTILDIFEHIAHIGDGRAYIVGDRPYLVYREHAGMLRFQSEISVNSICDTLNFYNQEYPQLNKYINTGALFFLLADIKHRRVTWKKTLSLWIKTFNISSLILIFKYWRIKSMFSR
jgi:glycosyltransferase involved in cell wall biosynthesis